MRVLVTGAGGFIGSHVTRELAARGHETHAWVRPGGTRHRLDGHSCPVRIHEVDLADANALPAALDATEPDAVVHAAWFVAPGAYLHSVQENLGSLTASVGLLANLYARGCQRIVLVGTCLENAGASQQPSIYATAKRALHDLALALAPSGPSVACGHVFYVHGPDEHRSRVVPSVVRALLRGDRIATTNGEHQRDYLHVADVASALAVLVEATLEGPVDICSGEMVSLRSVLEVVQSEIGGPGSVDYGALPSGADLVRVAAGDTRALRSLGWSPRFDMKSGLADTINWWKLQEEHARDNEP